MLDMSTVLTKKYKGMEWTLTDLPKTEDEFTKFFTIHKANGVTKPTWVKLKAQLVEMQAGYDSKVYSRNRKKEYDALDQFELISDDSINGTTTHKDAILAIKKKYSKK